MRELYQIGDFRAEIESREGYILIAETGRIDEAEAMRQYLEVIRLFGARTGHTRVLFDAREPLASAPGDLGARDARWDFFCGQRRLTRHAVVVASELAMMRVNMTARSKRAQVRAFLDLEGAHRWLVAK